MCRGCEVCRSRVNPDVGVKFPVNRMLAFRKVGRCIFR